MTTKQRKITTSLQVRPQTLEMIKTLSKKYEFSQAEVMRRALNFSFKKKYKDFIKLLEES